MFWPSISRFVVQKPQNNVPVGCCCRVLAWARYNNNELIGHKPKHTWPPLTIANARCLILPLAEPRGLWEYVPPHLLKIWISYYFLQICIEIVTVWRGQEGILGRETEVLLLISMLLLLLLEFPTSSVLLWPLSTPIFKNLTSLYPFRCRQLNNIYNHCLYIYADDNDTEEDDDDDDVNIVHVDVTCQLCHDVITS